MSQQRRRVWARRAAKIILVLLVLDLLAYAAVDRPLANLLGHEQNRFETARLQWLRERNQWAALERRDAALPEEQKQLESFLKRHIPVRREGYSRAARLIQTLTDQNGVQLSAIKYTMEDGRAEPFKHLGLETEVQGPFTNLLGFARALETASDFIVVRSFKFEAGDGGVLALHVRADLYLMP